MKAVLLSLVVLGACAHKEVKPIPAFEASKVCSPDSYSYLQKATDRPAQSKELVKEWEQEMKKLQPLMHACYQTSLEHTRDPQGYNVCLIADYDSTGKVKFFDFSSQEYKMAPELKNCLDGLSEKVDGKALKDTTFVQNVKLWTK